jgi:energy-coupling factor transporter transmembrane protein EcfT
MNRKQWIALVGIIILGVVLAFPMRDVVNQIIVVPLAYLFWVLGLYYRSYSQAIVWAIFIAVTLLFLLGSLLSGEWRRRKGKLPERSYPGPVEDLSVSLAKARQGIYHRWRVANRLSKVARDLLAQREGLAPREIQDKRLTGRDWSPPRDVDMYFQAGLFDSFSSYPRPRWWSLRRVEPTPFDLDVEEAVEYLEVQLRTTDERG